MPMLPIIIEFTQKGEVQSVKRVKEVSDAIDDAKKAAKDMTSSIDAAWKALGARPRSAIATEMKGIVTAFRDVKNSANVTAQDVSRAQEAMREKLRKLSEEARASAKATKEASETFSQASEKISFFGMTMGKLAGVAVGFFAINKIKAAALHAFNLAAQYETLGVVVQQVGKVSGYTAVEVDKNVSAIRRMGIAGVEARQTMTQLLQAQVDITQTPALARIAQDAAVIGGINSSEAFERLVYGIQSAQPMVLRAVGLNLSFEQSYVDLAKQLGKTTDELTEQEKVQARVNAVMEAGERIAGAYEAAMGTIGKQLSSLSRIHKDFFTDAGGFLTAIGRETGIVEGYSGVIETLNAEILIFTGLMSGISHEDLLAAFFQGGQALRDLVQGFSSSKTESETFKASLTAVSGVLGSMNTSWFMSQLAQLDADLKGKKITVDTYRRSLNELRVLMNAQLNQPAENAPKTGGFGVKDEVASLRESYKESSAGKREAEIKKIKSQQEKLQLYRNEFSTEEYSKLSKGLEERLKALNSSADSAASKAENATEKWKQFRLEIAALNGEGAKSAVTLEKQNKEIEDAGKAAGKSASEISQMQADYAAAFQSNTLKEFNKQIAQLEGNTKALRDIQLDEEVKKWSASFDELVKKEKMTTDEAAANIERLKTALAKNAEVKDAQTNLSFIKEFSDLSGNYNLTLEYQNKLLEAQSKIYGTQLTPELRALIPEWETLKKLQEARDPLSGSIRGLRSYSNEAMNLAKGIEGAWTGGFTAMEDAMVKFTMTGKLSFQDMANSIISDLMRIAIRSSITGPLASGLGSMFSGWGGGSGPITTPGFTNANLSGSIWGSGFHSGGVVGVDSPTFTRAVSAYDYLHAPRFHSGGGFFKRDEYPAILQYGERVLNRQETAAYNAREWAGRDVMGRSGAAAQATPQVFVSIQNNTGAEVSQETRTDNMGRKNIRVIIGDAAASQMVTAGSSLDKATRARFGIQPQVTRR